MLTPGPPHAPPPVSVAAPLAARLREVLLAQAQAGGVVTYRELAERLALTPPHTIHRVTEALEVLMAEDAAAGRPLLAVLCVSRQQGGIPRRGFFITAAALGLYSGPDEGDKARAFHRREHARALLFYRSTPAA